MGMSGSTYNAQANAITKKGYDTLGGPNNPSLYKVQHHNGAHTYTTYHLNVWRGVACPGRA